MATFYKYLQPSEMVVDLQNNLKIIYEKGIVDSIMVCSKPNTEDGFIFIYTRAWNNPYKNTLRFSYTLAEFQKITFSKEAVGLSYFITQDEINNTLYSWNLLTNSEKIFYISAAESFVSKGFVPFWRTEWNIPEAPTSRVVIKRGTNTLVSGINVTSTATKDVQLTMTFEISNAGSSVLDISGITTIPSTDITIIQPTDLSLLPGEAILFGVNALYTTTGTKNFTIRVATNDTTLPVFSIPVVVTVD